MTCKAKTISSLKESKAAFSLFCVLLYMKLKNVCFATRHFHPSSFYCACFNGEWLKGLLDSQYSKKKRLLLKETDTEKQLKQGLTFN